MAIGIDDPDPARDIGVLYTAHDGRVAASEQPSGARKGGDPKAVTSECQDQFPRVSVLDEGDKQLHAGQYLLSLMDSKERHFLGLVVVGGNPRKCLQ